MTTEDRSRSKPGSLGGTSTYSRLKAAILRGELAEGTNLVESALATRFDVSRTPVREALTRLEQDGLVERGDRGLMVRTRSPEEILDIYEVRVVLEAKAAQMAAERRTDFDLVRIRQLLERGEALTHATAEEFAGNNRDFHQAVWQASRNESLLDLLRRLELHLTRYPNTTLSYEGRWARAMVQHARLVDALADRDGQRAAAIATEHFSEARDIRLRLWQDELSGTD